MFERSAVLTFSASVHDLTFDSAIVIGKVVPGLGALVGLRIRTSATEEVEGGWTEMKVSGIEEKDCEAKRE